MNKKLFLCIMFTILSYSAISTDLSYAMMRDDEDVEVNEAAITNPLSLLSEEELEQYLEATKNGTPLVYDPRKDLYYLTPSRATPSSSSTSSLSSTSTPHNLKGEEILKVHMNLFKSHLREVANQLSTNAIQIPTISFLYNEDNDNHIKCVKFLALDLKESGIPLQNIFFDRLINRLGSGGDTTTQAYKVLDAEKIIIIGSPGLKQRYENQEENVNQEITSLQKQPIDPKKGARIIPVWFEGKLSSNFPTIFQKSPFHFLGNDYFTEFFDLLTNILHHDSQVNYILPIKKDFKKRRSYPDSMQDYGKKVLEMKKKEIEDSEQPKNKPRNLPLQVVGENPFVKKRLPLGESNTVSSTSSAILSESVTSPSFIEVNEEERSFLVKLLEKRLGEIKSVAQTAQDTEETSKKLMESTRRELLSKRIHMQEQEATQNPFLIVKNATPILAQQKQQLFEESGESEAFYSFFNKEKKYASILSLDGGGFRGLMEAYWLAHLESKDVANRQPYQLFNLIAGTSMGGILALGATIPSENGKIPAMSPNDMIDLFVHKANKIFPKRWEYNYPMKFLDKVTETVFCRYSEKPLEELLISYFNNRRLNTALTNVVVTSAIADTQQPFHFNSFEERTKDYMAYEVGRATSAAPTYFKPYSLILPGNHAMQNLVDGGIWYNNPSQIAYEATIRWAKQQDYIVLPENLIMLSLGTGVTHNEYVQAHNVGRLNTVSPLIESMMSISSEGVDQGMRSSLPKGNYTRINTKLTKNIALDDITQENIEQLRLAAETQYERIETFVKDGRLRLILERDEIQ